jgi:hypothetical protein
MHCVQNTYCVGKPQDIHSLTSPTESYSRIIFSESLHNSQDSLTDKCTALKGLLVNSKLESSPVFTFSFMENISLLRFIWKITKFSNFFYLIAHYQRILDKEGDVIFFLQLINSK